MRSKMNYYFLLIININIVFERISNQLEEAITNFTQKCRGIGLIIKEDIPISLRWRENSLCINNNF